MSKTLYTRHGGYRKLYSFTFATMIHLATIKFCKRFVSFKDDPLGKTAGQMVGAARSGRQNIIEGSERADDLVAANSMLVLVGRTTGMLDAQLKRLGTDFAEEGGFRERMYQVRNAERTQTNSPEENSPDCPKCGKPMRRRMPNNGANPGTPFWGCTGFPNCRATRPV